MLLLNIAPGVSRLHASRHVFEALREHDLDVPVIHHRTCAHTSRPGVDMYAALPRLVNAVYRPAFACCAFSL